MSKSTVVMYNGQPVSSGNPLPVQLQNRTSMWRADTHAGYGSTDTMIPYFTNIRSNIGLTSNYTITNDSTNGLKIVINNSGMYSISCSSNGSATRMDFGISLNSTQLTTNIISINAETRLAASDASSDGGGGTAGNCSWVGYLSAGDVVRMHTSGTSLATAALAHFTIARVF